jgi:hypothetical protein
VREFAGFTEDDRLALEQTNAAGMFSRSTR